VLLRSLACWFVRTCAEINLGELFGNFDGFAPWCLVSVQEECGEAHLPLDLVDSVSVEMNEDLVILAFVVDVATCFMIGDCCSEEAAFGDLLMTATTGRTRCWRQSGCDPASMACSASIIQHSMS